MRILITGSNSYIGNHVMQLCNNRGVQCDEIDVRDSSWKNKDFSSYYAIVHVAAIVHQNEKNYSDDIYDNVNVKLTIDVAKKAKKEGVKKFLFLSTMGVYGKSSFKYPITLDTPVNPITKYAKSKYKAENEVRLLQEKDFKICVLRPPLVYGENSPGNMSKLIKLVTLFHLFPNYQNERSVISIDVLCEEILHLLYEGDSGIYLPQNKEYMCTSDYIYSYCESHDIKIFLFRFLNPMIYFLIGRINVISKIFGDLKYEK